MVRGGSGGTLDPAPRPTPAAARALWAATALLLAGAGLYSLWRMHPTVAGVDFHAYLCFARDLLSPQGASEARFAYFPGVFLFWKGILALLGPGPRGLGAAYGAVLLANAALAGLLAARFSPAGTRRAAGACALGLCLLLDLGLEGYIGATEPIATLPVLLGLWAFGGAPLRGREGLWRALALGLSLGLACFIKQQAGLLALAWLSLLPDGRAGRHAPGPLLVIPAAAAGLLVALLWGSGGLFALTRGLGTARGYGLGPDGAAGSSVPVLVSLAVALAAAALLPLLLRRLLDEAWARGAAFALAAGAAALAQLIVRPYLHYALLGLPLLCVAAVALLAQALQRAGALQRGRELFAPLAAVQGALALAVALVPAEVRSPSAWPQVPAREWPAGRPAAAEAEQLRALVAPGSALVLLPPRRAVLHLTLGTRADRWPMGYFWGPPQPGLALQVVRDPAVRSVLQVAPADESDKANLADFGVPEALAALPGLGYTQVSAGKELVLWRRP